MDILRNNGQPVAQATNPPAPYATVVALSERKMTLRYGQVFTDVKGSTITTDPKITRRGIYGIGDGLKLIEKADVIPEVLAAAKHVVVGFSGKNVVIQLDDNLVVDDSPDNLKKYYEVATKFDGAAVPTAIIIADGKFFEIPAPKDIEIRPGDTVILSTKTMDIIGLGLIQPGGGIGYVRRIVDETLAEVDFNSAVRVVFRGTSGTKIENGDRVVLDDTGSVIIRNLGRDDERFRFCQTTKITWDDIGGLAEAKRIMIEIVELPHSNPDLFKGYGKKPVKGVLLYGPPGCGKTMLGKATVTSLATIYNGNTAAAASGFIYIKGPEILDRWVGAAEATVRQIFARASKHRAEHGFPAVIFIEEADAILGKRGSGISSDVERTIVPMWLSEMDGLHESGALVILATNRADMLDSAIVRDGRIDRKIYIPRPDAASAVEIFKLNLKGVPLCNGYTSDALAKLGSDELFSPSRVLYRVETKEGQMGFTLGHIVNGGMIASAVDQATSIALNRDLAEKKKKLGGLRKEDLVAAVNGIERQNRDLDHEDDLSEFVHDFRKDVVGIQKLRQSR